ncbi:MAG TPA: hypothetical protein VLG69_03705 [Candidatus Andersenbacteria bacterium]|nr:hypothetical protein [Candidatus Andersenbacteria bacterium]
MKRIIWTVVGGVLVALVPVLANAATKFDDVCYGDVQVPETVHVGEKFKAIVEFRNTGSAWIKAQHFALGSQEPQDNTIWGLGRVNMTAPVIYNNRLTSFTFYPTAPKKPGSYSFSWQMLQERVGWFGKICRPAHPIEVLGKTAPTQLTCDPSILPPGASPLPSPAPSQVIVPDGLKFIDIHARLSIGSSSIPINGATVTWSTNQGSHLISPISAITKKVGDLFGMATTKYTLNLTKPQVNVITAHFNPQTINGTQFQASTCSVTVVPVSLLATPTPTSTSTPMPTPIISPFPTPSSSAEFTATITRPVTDAQFTPGQKVTVTVMGKGSPVCGTWKLYGPDGQPRILTANDFAEGKLPGNLKSCQTDPYNTPPY